jgi:predicted PurR-regulated permease PerM
MTLRRQLGFWTVSLIAFIAFLAVFSQILLPFVAGMAVAYLLDPVCDRLEALGFSRLWATLTILLAFVFVLVLFFVLLVPVLGNQLAGFLEKLPDLVRSLHELVSQNFGERLVALTGINPADLQSSFGKLMGQGASWLGGLAQQVWSGGQALLSILSLFVITPVVAFYLLLDWDHMVARIDGWLPRDHLEEIRGLAREMDDAFPVLSAARCPSVFSGRVLCGRACAVAGLNFGLLIGMGAGLVSFIPFVGAGLGLIVSLGVAVVQFWPDWPMILVIAAIFAVGQFLEGNILQPKLVGDSTGLHPGDADVRPVCLWISLWICGDVDCRSGSGHDRRACTFRAEAVPSKPGLPGVGLARA